MSKQTNREPGITRETRMPLRRMQRAHLATPLTTSGGQALQAKLRAAIKPARAPGRNALKRLRSLDRQTGSWAHARGKRRHRQKLRRRGLPRADRDVDGAGLSNLRKQLAVSQS
jgi:hypothetical protein